MMIALSLAYFAALIWAAYRLGDRGAGYGVALFIGGAVAFSVVVNGPESLLQAEGCARYSSIADGC